MKLRLFILPLLLIHCTLIVAQAQTPVLRRLGLTDGLPHNQVNVIRKTGDGFVWVGTASGLGRYDGYGFKTFRCRVDGLSDDFVDRITVDGSSRLWIRTDRGRWNLYDPVIEDFCPGTNAWLAERGIEGEVHEVYADGEGVLWVYVGWRGLYCLDASSQTARSVLIADGGLPKEHIAAMGECADGLLLVYDNGCVVCVDRQSMQTLWRLDDVARLLGEGRYDNFSLYVDRDGDIWVYGALGTFVYSGTSHSLLKLRFSDEGGTDLVTAVAQTTDGRVWIGYDHGDLGYVDKQTGQAKRLHWRTPDPADTRRSTITTMLADESGMLYVGTYKHGLACYAESMYKFGFDAIGDINCMAQAADGSLYIGTNDNELLRTDSGEWRVTDRRGADHEGQGPTAFSARRIPLPISSAIVSLLVSHDGCLWIGTFRDGLLRMGHGQTTAYRAGQGGLANDRVWSLAEDAEGGVWIGTLGGGVQRLDPRTGRFQTYDISTTSLSSNYIASLCVAKDGRVWIGTASQGVSILQPRTGRVVDLSARGGGTEGLTNPCINHVVEDSRGLIWIGTRGGLNVYDPEADSLTVVPLSPQPEEDFVSAIAEDLAGDMWVTTTDKMVRIHLSRLSHYSLSTVHCLLNPGFNQRSILRLATGELLVGGMSGISTLRPDDIKRNTTKPRVMFTHLYVYNEEIVPGQQYEGRVVMEQSLNQGRRVVLGYRQNNFTVVFASDNYVLPEKTTYTYQLEGLDTQWLTADAQEHRATYTHLSPGTYLLRVKAINNDGVAGDEDAVLTIVVKPPFYLTPWAYVVYGLLALALAGLVVWLIRRREQRHLRMQQREQEARHTEELNQMKFRFFTNVSHELRTPLTLILSPLDEMLKTADGRQAERLQMMHRNAVRLLTLVNQLLDFRKSEMAGLQLNLAEGDVVAYLRSVCDNFLALSEKSGVHLTFFSSVDELYMAFDEDKLGKVLTNLLSNAFKFTPDGGRVDVAIDLDSERPAASHEQSGKADPQSHLVIRVSDTGIGISDADKPRVFDRFYQVDNAQAAGPNTGSGIGLSLVKDFVALHGGTVRVTDNVERGSVFVVTIPVRKASPRLPADQGARPATNEADKKLPLALIVDDNADLLSFASDSLSLFFRIRTAVDGEQAWRLLQTGTDDAPLQPDIVVCDVMMPHMDGLELCRRIKAEQHTAHIPVILLSAKQRTEDRLQGLQAGADDYVSKPFNVEILTLRMRRLVSLSHNARPRTHIEPEPTEQPITTVDERLVEKAIKYVEANISRPELSVEEMSRAMGMSRVNLYKKLLRITGRTPIEFIRIIRLKRAAQMLRDSQLNVSELAYSIGFNSPKYFTKYFKEEFGLTPSAYQELKAQTQTRPKQETKRPLG